MKSGLSAWGVALVALGLLLTVAVFGPDMALRLCLGRLLPGTSLDYVREGGLWTGRAVVLKNLSLTSDDLGRLTMDRAEISGLRLLNLLRARPGLELAESLNFTNLGWELGGWTLAARSIEALRPRRPAAETDPPFYSLVLTGPQGEGPRAEAGFRMDRLALIDGRAVMDGLNFKALAGAGLWTAEIKGLTLSGFMTAVDRWLQSGGRTWALLPEIFHLQMDSGQLALDGRPALMVRTARPEPRFVFTEFSSEAVSYNYFLEFTFIPSALAGADPFWPNLAGLTGEPLDFELSLDLTLDPWDRAVQVRSLSLDGLTLGRLDLAAELSSLGPEGDTAAGWLAALYPARLHGLSLAFQDQGLLPGYYAWLAGVAGWNEAEVPARLKGELLAPLFGILAEEGVLANLPALALAAEAFLDQPENLMVSAGPDRPLALARLVKMDKYDIISNLKITLTVNDQPTIALGAASEVKAAPEAAADPVAEDSPRSPSRPPGE